MLLEVLVFGEHMERLTAVSMHERIKSLLLGICLGMQVIAIEFARNVIASLGDANSTEFDESTKNPVVSDMPEYNVEKKGGTMRLGSEECAYRQK